MFVPTPEMGFMESLGVAARLGKVAIQHPEGVVSLFTQGNEPVAASIDVTPNCNLRCNHCYLYEKPYQEEGTNSDKFLEKVKQLKEQHPGLIHCTWVGGEPMSRKTILREAVKIFPSNWVVTNGTVPIDGEWKRTTFFLSIDGTEGAHNKIRQPWQKAAVKDSSPLANVYQTAKKTAKTATAPVFVHTVINKVNLPTIPDLVAEWRKDGFVRGFAFSLHTPIVDPSRPSGMSESDEKLYLSDDQRREIVSTLLGLKKQNGKFIGMSESMIKNILPEKKDKVWNKRCSLTTAVFSADTKFGRKQPCVMGPGMDCDRCGCVIPSMVERGKRLDFSTLRAIAPFLS